MLSRNLFCRTAFALAKCVNQTSLYKRCGQHVPSPFVMAKRPLVLFVSGMSRLEEEEEEAWNQFDEDIENMAGDDDPFERKVCFLKSACNAVVNFLISCQSIIFIQEHLRGKDIRYMKKNSRLGRRSNYKVRALVDLINYKRASRASL